MDRSAVDTIRGYCYQFDKAILEILSLTENSDYVDIECLEDVDVFKDGELQAIQCKYYECTDYNHSVIAEPIRLMLTHFSKNPEFFGKYHLYGHYKDGQYKLKLPIELDYLKDKFLTYKREKIEHKLHSELGLNDEQLNQFLEKLSIDINAKDFDAQKSETLESLAAAFNCDLFIAEHYFYNGSFSLISNIACKKGDRRISRQMFFGSIDKSAVLFNAWLYKYKGRNAYLKKIKSDLFSRVLNTQPYDRFFLLDASRAASIADVNDCIRVIQRKWSNLSKRIAEPYSPFIYLFGVTEDFKWKLKNQLYNEGLRFVDGYGFKGSNFCPESMLKAKKSIDIHFQFLETEEDFFFLANASKSKIEIIQFFHNQKIELRNNLSSTDVQIHEFNDIKEII